MRIGTGHADAIIGSSSALSIVQEVSLKTEVSAWAQSAVEKPDICGGHFDYWGGTFQPYHYVNIWRVCSCWLTSPQHILIENVAKIRE